MAGSSIFGSAVIMLVRCFHIEAIHFVCGLRNSSRPVSVIFLNIKANISTYRALILGNFLNRLAF